MSSFDTLIESTTISLPDKFLVNQGSVDGGLTFQLLLETMFPIGAIISQINLDNPSLTGYPGTWNLIEDDIAFENTLSGDSGVGVIVGSNTETVHLPVHTHTSSVSMVADHTHLYDYTFSQSTAPIYNPADPTFTYHISTNDNAFVTNSSGEHSHNVTVSASGVPSTDVDVRGQRVSLVFWERVG